MGQKPTLPGENLVPIVATANDLDRLEKALAADARREVVDTGRQVGSNLGLADHELRQWEVSYNSAGR
jgi:hypothetical protein